ncbi:germin-like protein [Beta vulgaris subsp. vulgaris]|uniref:germin-like protein n=1 Tax=Beta vulgaris subsp. vulgaris TaxID=3555 RepID=UPI0020374E5F|nr:germin-like protein [Beta vulgaris subsp. vulgaris]
MEAHNKFLTYVTLLTVTCYVAYATDPTQLQDFCVGVNNPIEGLFVNGLFCKDPMRANPNDFFFEGLDVPGDTDNKLGFVATQVTAANLPGLNTLGISIARLDFAPYGLNPPHTHPRATEIFTVLEGAFYVGFVTSNLANAKNKLFAKLLNKGDVFVFPQGLIHFQLNVGHTPGFALAALSSQNPGVITIANAVFGSQPPISVDVLTKAFQIEGNLVKYLQAQFGAGNY